MNARAMVRAVITGPGVVLALGLVLPVIAALVTKPVAPAGAARWVKLVAAWLIACAVASTSSPSSSPVTTVSPMHIAPKISARCEIDLSPGT